MATASRISATGDGQGIVDARWGVECVRSWFQRRRPLILRHVCLQVRGARIGLPHRPLHNLQALAVLDARGATCVAEMVDGGARVARGVEPLSRTTRQACAHHRGIPGQA
jgi:hypothetical protein